MSHFLGQLKNIKRICGIVANYQDASGTVNQVHSFLDKGFDAIDSEDILAYIFRPNN